jgi:hypothetical protein
MKTDVCFHSLFYLVIRVPSKTTLLLVPLNTAPIERERGFISTAHFNHVKKLQQILHNLQQSLKDLQHDNENNPSLHTISCTRCGCKLETLAHVLGQCTQMKTKSLIDTTLSHFVSSKVAKKDFSVTIQALISTPDGTLKPNLVVKHQKRVHVVDITIRHEDVWYLQKGYNDKVSKLTPLLPMLAEQQGIDPGQVLLMFVGTRGVIPKSTITSSELGIVYYNCHSCPAQLHRDIPRVPGLQSNRSRKTHVSRPSSVTMTVTLRFTSFQYNSYIVHLFTNIYFPNFTYPLYYLILTIFIH